MREEKAKGEGAVKAEEWEGAVAEAWGEGRADVEGEDVLNFVKDKIHNTRSTSSVA
jgi:hypothetical protein